MNIFFKLLSFLFVTSIAPFLFTIGCMGVLFTEIISIMDLLN